MIWSPVVLDPRGNEVPVRGPVPRIRRCSGYLIDYDYY